MTTTEEVTYLETLDTPKSLKTATAPGTKSATDFFINGADIADGKAPDVAGRGSSRPAS